MNADVLQPAFDKAFEEGWHRLHDCMVEFESRKYSKEEVRKVFDLLPRNIKIEAVEWGLNDTVVGDSCYTYLENINWKP